MRHVMTKALDMLGSLTQQMAAMQAMCIYRLNGVCWEHCRARAYCLPDENGLRTVADVINGAPRG